MSLSGVRDIVGTPGEDIEYELFVERLPSIWRKRKAAGKKKQSIMILTGSKSETFFL